jgi:peroxiredoxin
VSNPLPLFGQEAPDFTLPGPDGKDVALRSFRGKPVILLFYCFDWGSI